MDAAFAICLSASAAAGSAVSRRRAVRPTIVAVDRRMSVTAAPVLSGGGRMAEGVGFEPTVPGGTMVFETIRFGRSRIPPRTILGGRGAVSPGVAACALTEPAGRGRRTRGSRRTRPRCTPGTTGNSWFRRGSTPRWYRLPSAPAFGSAAPNVTRPIRAETAAPAHIGQGSSVTTSAQSSSRHDPTDSAARRSASTSARAVGSAVCSARCGRGRRPSRRRVA